MSLKKKVSVFAVMSTLALNSLVGTAFAAINVSDSNVTNLTVNTDTELNISGTTSVTGNVNLKAKTTIYPTGNKVDFSKSNVTLAPKVDSTFDLGGVKTNKIVIGSDHVTTVNGFVAPTSGVESTPGVTNAPEFTDVSGNPVEPEIKPQPVVVDKADLTTKINGAKAKVETDYTPESWTAADLANVIDAAEAVLNDTNATQAEVDAQEAKVDAAVAKLVEKTPVVVDKADLTTKINGAKAKVETDYTPESWTAADLANVIDAAEAVLNDTNATQAEVDAQEAKVDAAVAKLVEKTPVVVDKADLTTKINGAKAKVETDYTPESWTAADLANVIDAAEAVLNDTNATQAEVDAQEAKVDAAVAKLVEKTPVVVDKADLTTKINGAKAKVETDYTPESWTAADLANVIDAAEAVLNDTNATQAEVDAQEAKVDAAVAKLVEKTPVVVDKADLTTKINGAKAKVETDYTPESWTAADLANVIDAAEAVLNDTNATQAEVDAQEAKVDAAVAKLVEKTPVVVDKADLTTKINGAKAKVETDYTPESWTAADLANVIDAAEAVLNDTNATQAEVDAQEAKVDAAVAKLVEKTPVVVDKADLTTKINGAKAKVETDYTPESWTAADLANVIDAAEAVLNDTNATQAEVDAQEAKVDAAVAKLVEKTPVVVDKADLTTKINGAKAKVETDYTPESWTAADLANVIDAAEAVLNDTNATQAEVDAQEAKVDAAVAKLVEKTPVVVDKADLTTKINGAKAKVETDYTPESWTAADLANVIDAAEAVLNDTNATQAEVDAQEAKVDAAVAKLVEKTPVVVDKADLTTKINGAKAKVETDYTPESWTAADLANVIDAAEAVLNDTNATQAEVDAQEAKVDAAVAKLVEKTPVVVDKADLTTKINGAKAKVETDYTPESWTAADLANVIDAAEAVLNDTNATQAEVDAQEAKVDAAVAKLVEKTPVVVDKADLTTKINGAKAKVETDYTPESWTAADLANVIDAAEAVLNDTNATQAEVDAQEAKVDAAVAKLVVAIDTESELIAALASAQAGDTIKLAGNIEVTDKILVDKAVTIDGQNHTLTLNGNGQSQIASGLGINANANVKNLTVTTTANLTDNLVEVFGTNVHAVLENVIIKDSKQAGLTILDDATVALKGSIALTGNAWGGIEVEHDTASNVEFTLGATLTYTPGSKTNAPVVWLDAAVDNPTPYVTDTAVVLADPVYVTADGTIVAGPEAGATQVWFNLKPAE
ncbi:FIVAR domain-containing protein [Brevibacillus choshinensis]|uniref:FIVAR domain-containing protein n=1 Tax=Brevibacillus choshinensis TaxID=54911 RepID=A0ABX7FNL3_BRECH|nr:FIVAR domain-containing protein [Brevibacillus choshinensis]QRG67343.1 FIVAR domain-containing protein [Brevibacillus choshinensis]